VAVTWDYDKQKVRLVAHKVFQPSTDEPLDFEIAVEHTLLALHNRFDLRLALFDPYQMQASAQRLQRESIEIEEFPQSVRTSPRQARTCSISSRAAALPFIPTTACVSPSRAQ
jgi:phage terminase large subunit-like protein